MSGIKVAELFAELGIVIDEAAMNKADKWLKDQSRKLDKLNIAKKVNQQFGKALNWAAAGVGATLVAGAKDALDFDRALTQLNVSSSGATGSVAEMHDQFLKLSQSTGLAKEELLAGAQAYVALTGDGAGAGKAVATFARVATASGAAMADVSGAAAALKEQFGLMPTELEDAFSILIRGGKAGKIELKEMASLTASLGAAFKQFGGSQGLGGAAQLGAMFQVAARNFGSASEASTGLERLMSNIQASEFKFAKMGVVFRKSGKAGKGEFKDVVTIVKQLGAVLDKDPKKFQKMFGENIIAKQALLALYQNIGAVEQLTVATRGAKDVTEDLATVQGSASFKAQKAWNDTKVAIARAFTPERVEQLANAITRVLAVVTRLIDAVGGVDNAVTALIVTWGILKSAQLLGFLGKLAAQLWGVAAASAAANGAGSLGKMGVGSLAGLGAKGLAASAGLVAGAGAVGYGVGTGLDQTFGWSDRIAGWASGMEKVGDYRDPRWMAARAKAKEQRERAKAGALGGAPGTTLNSSVTVNANGVDPEGVMRIADKAAREHAQQMMREAAATAAGGGGT
jgi:TP901 family phage tail tape measure protein